MTDPHPHHALQADSSAASDTASDQPVVQDLLKVFGKAMQYATTDWITLDLSSAQVKVLFTLHYSSEEMGGYTVNQLAERLNVGASTASHLADKLVQAGLARRIDSVADRRIVHVLLTEEGHAMAKRLWGGRDVAIAHWVAQLAPADLIALTQGIHALRAIVEQSIPVDSRR